MTRDKFEDLVEDATKTAMEWLLTAADGEPLGKSVPEAHAAMDARLAVMRAWDAQAAEVERLRAEVEALRVGVPLTAENAPRARVVEDADGNIWICAAPWWRHLSGAKCHVRDFLSLHPGATVLAWRK